MTCEYIRPLVYGCTDQPFTFMTPFELWYWTCVKNCPDETNSPKARLKTNINRAFQLIRNLQVHRTFNSSVAEPTFNCSSLFCSHALWMYNNNNLSSPALPVNFTTRLLCVCFSFAIYLGFLSEVLDSQVWQGCQHLRFLCYGSQLPYLPDPGNYCTIQSQQLDKSCLLAVLRKVIAFLMFRKQILWTHIHLYYCINVGVWYATCSCSCCCIQLHF